MGTGKSPAAKAVGGTTAKTAYQTEVDNLANGMLGANGMTNSDLQGAIEAYAMTHKGVDEDQMYNDVQNAMTNMQKMTPNQKARSIATASQRQEMNNLDKKYAVGNEMPKTSRVAGTVTKAPTYGVDDQGRITVAWESQYKFLGATTTTQWSAILVDGGKNSPAKLWKIQHTQTHSIDKKKRTKNDTKQT